MSEYSLDEERQSTKLSILGASAGTASSKARRFLRKRGHTKIRIELVEWEGTVDVF